jgi:hypothetical protein
MPSDGTIGGPVGKLLVLDLECPTCGRQGRYHVARLLAELGPGYRLTDWLHPAHGRLSTKEPCRRDASLRRSYAGLGRPAINIVAKKQHGPNFSDRAEPNKSGWALAIRTGTSDAPAPFPSGSLAPCFGGGAFGDRQHRRLRAWHKRAFS